MIKEYALQPELLSSWPVCRDLSEKFGYSRGRVIARYPKRWERLVLDSLHDCMPMEKQKIVERLNILKNSALYPRHHEWDPEKLRLDNVLAEHTKRPFDAIISQDNPNAFAAVICRADLDELEEPLQIVAHRPASIPVERIEIHTGHKTVETKDLFDEHLQSIIPRGMKIRLVRWDQSYLHDRFILTNSCGLEFSPGLDGASYVRLPTSLC